MRRRYSEGCLPTPSSHGSEEDDIGDTVQDLMEEVASLEEVISQIDASSKMPFNSHNAADCHLNDLYHPSVDETTQ